MELSIIVLYQKVKNNDYFDMKKFKYYIFKIEISDTFLLKATKDFPTYYMYI